MGEAVWPRAHRESAWGPGSQTGCKWGVRSHGWIRALIGTSEKGTAMGRLSNLPGSRGKGRSSRDLAIEASCEELVIHNEGSGGPRMPPGYGVKANIIGNSSGAAVPLPVPVRDGRFEVRPAVTTGSCLSNGPGEPSWLVPQVGPWRTCGRLRSGGFAGAAGHGPCGGREERTSCLRPRE